MDALHNLFSNVVGTVKNEWRSVINTHYIGEFILSMTFFVLKASLWCDYVFETCELKIGEWELLASFGVLIMIKAKKQTTLRNYFKKVFMFAKVLNVCLFFKQGPLYVIIYVAAWMLQTFFNPEPSYKGPERITYFRATALDAALERDKKIKWFVSFSAPWCPPCSDFSPIFAELSEKYGDLENFQFGKVDVSRYPEVAKTHDISTSTFSKQLPTVILFEEGKEKDRQPLNDSKGRVAPFTFTAENVVSAFNLDTVYKESQELLSKQRKRGKQVEVAEESGDKKTN